MSYLWESIPKIKEGKNQKADNIHQKIITTLNYMQIRAL